MVRKQTLFHSVVACPYRSDSGERRELGEASEKNKNAGDWGEAMFPAFFFRSLFSAPFPYSSHLFHYLNACNRLQCRGGNRKGSVPQRSLGSGFQKFKNKRPLFDI